MSRFSKRAKVIADYWHEVFGDNPVGACSITISVLLLALIYAIAMFWMVPASVFRAMRIESSIV